MYVYFVLFDQRIIVIEYCTLLNSQSQSKKLKLSKNWKRVGFKRLKLAFVFSNQTSSLNEH